MNKLRLTAEQEKAVKSNSQYIAIIAGAGSGKTKTLTERICYLITENGVKPEEILALTFTSKAAQEMKKRVIANLGDNAKGIWIKTFHSFGLELLRMYNEYTGLADKFEIVDSTAKLNYVKKIINKQKVLLEPKDTVQVISKIKNKITDCVKSFLGIFDDYNRVLHENNVVDLDDMIWMTVKLIKDNPPVQNYLHNRFKHVLIDEFQDTNDIQNEMINLMLSKEASLCVVGDDDQCIYEWRGSKPQYIRNFANRKDVETIFLGENFRSQKYVVDIANKFISHNQDRIEKRMYPQLSSKAKPEFYKAENEEKEAQIISSIIKKLYNSGEYRYKDIAILIRSSKQMQTLTSTLRNNSIPFSTKQEDSNVEFMSFIRVLYAIIDYRLNNNISRAVNFPNTSLSNMTYMDLVDDYKLNSLTVVDALEYLYKSDVEWKDCELFRKRYGFILSLNEKIRDKKHITTEILNEVYSFYKSENIKTETYLNKLEYVENTIQIAEDWEKSTEKCNIQAFVDYLVCAMENEDEIFTNEHDDEVGVLTCHRAKGLEFPVVIIPGVHVGSFPNDFFIHSESDLEQERRLFYVALTRAVDRLYITCYQNPYGTGSNSLVRKGFVSEIPELIEWRKERLQK